MSERATIPESVNGEPTLASIMTRDVVVIDAATALRDAMQMFADEQITGAPVVQGGAVVGVVSTTDFLAFRVETDDGVSTFEDEEAGYPEEENPFFLDAWGDTGPDLIEPSAVDAPELDRFGSHTVSDIMSPRVYSLPSTAPVREAAQRLLELQIHRILVIDDEELVGLVTTTDIVRAVAEGIVQGSGTA